MNEAGHSLLEVRESDASHAPLVDGFESRYRQLQLRCWRVARGPVPRASKLEIASYGVFHLSLVLNIVAVILENFSTLHNTDTNLVSAFDLEAFNEAWAQFDALAAEESGDFLASCALRVPGLLAASALSEILNALPCDVVVGVTLSVQPES